MPKPQLAAQRQLLAQPDPQKLQELLQGPPLAMVQKCSTPRLEPQAHPQAHVILNACELRGAPSQSRLPSSSSSG